MKAYICTLVLLAALAVSPALAALPAALPLGQLLQQGDAAVYLFPENGLPPGVLKEPEAQQFGLAVLVQSGRPNAARLQMRALIETEDGIRKWYRLEAKYKLPLNGTGWVPVVFNTGSQKVVAVYALEVTVIDAGQQQSF